MADSEQVTSPDQHKPTNTKLARVGGVGTVLALLAMLFGFPITDMERLWLGGVAALLVAILVSDWLLRKNGLRS